MIAHEEKNRQRIKLLIIVLISVLAILSAVIFISSRGGESSITVEFTTRILNTDNKQEGNYLVAGKDAVITFKLIDNSTGQPISGLDPEITFSSSETGESVAEHSHISPSSVIKSELSLPKIQLFVLNSERGTIAVLDTFGNYDPKPSDIEEEGAMTSKVIRLKGSPNQKVADIVAGRYGDYVYATLPKENQVAVVDAISHEVVKYIDVGKTPGRMFLQPNSEYLWISNDGSGSVSIIDTDTNFLAKTIETGKGHHQVVFSPENAYVTNSENNTVAIIRLGELTKFKDIWVHEAPYGIDYSKAGNEVYLVNTLQGTVSVIDAKTNKIKEYIPLSKGIEMIRFSPDGRMAVVLNPYANISYLIDAANSTLIKAIETGDIPNAVEFIEDLAIVRNAYSPDVTYISITDPNISIDKPVGNEPSMTWMPHSLIITASGDEAVITNPREGRIYFMRKMRGELHSMAPKRFEYDPNSPASKIRRIVMASAEVEYGSDAVAIVESKLHETGPGIYQQHIILYKEGPFEVEFKTRRINTTFKIEVLPDLTEGFRTTALFNKTLLTGKPSTLQYRITERRTGQPEENLTDLIYVVISKGTWIKRVLSKYDGNGTYEATITFPEEGDYMVTLTSDTLSDKGYEATYDYITVGNSTN